MEFIPLSFVTGLIAIIAIGFAVREHLERKKDITILKKRAEELADLHEELRLTHLDLEQQNREVRLANVEVQMHNSQLKAISDDRLMILGMVSHDLKNPLTAIQGLAEAMTTVELTPEEYQEYAMVILDSSYRMNNLIRGLLDLSRIEAGSIRLETIVFNIADTIQALVEQYQHTATKKRITLCMEMQENTNFSVLADEFSSQQVIENILSNAIKYSPHGTTVTIRITIKHNVGAGAVLFKEDLERLDELTNEAHQSYVRIEFSDEGPGLSTEDKLKLFGKFARLSARPTGGEDSTGLGLAIVKMLVEAMNGRVWCESELGKGATFIVELPTANAGSL
ncbi:MAG: sensor histidine kinase [Candidatus Kapaibacteriota bacterium]